jgi:hypothetical protein
MGRDYSRSKQFSPSIRCQTLFGLSRTVKAEKVARSGALTVLRERILASSRSIATQAVRREMSVLGAAAFGGGDTVKPRPDRFDLLAAGHSRSRSR